MASMLRGVIIVRQLPSCDDGTPLPLDREFCALADLEKLLRTASEIHDELDWAALVLTGDRSSSRIFFGQPDLVPMVLGRDANWTVEVRCRPDQDDVAQAAIDHVAEKWNLAALDADRWLDLASAYRAGAIAGRREHAINPHDDDSAKRKAWAAGHTASFN